MEDSKAKALLKTYRSIRQELRDRLDFLPGDTFTAQRLRGTLLQVDGALEAMRRGLLDDSKEQSIDVAQLGVTHLTTEIETFSKHFEGAIIPINLNALMIATDTSNFLINRYEASLEAYNKDIRASITQGLTEATIQQVSLGEVVKRIGRFFLAEEWKLLRIARTELHNMYNLGKLNGMNDIRKQLIPDLKKTLIHPMDARTGADSKELARENPIIDTDKPFSFKWRGKERVFMTPPDRPNDRSILIPVRKSWNK
jgi:hypothetical protein